MLCLTALIAFFFSYRHAGHFYDTLCATFVFSCFFFPLVVFLLMLFAVASFNF